MIATDRSRPRTAGTCQSELQRFTSRCKMNAALVGRLAHGDRRFLQALENGSAIEGNALISSRPDISASQRQTGHQFAVAG